MIEEPAVKLCICEHGKELHQHYRDGTDCAACRCKRYVPAQNQAFRGLVFALLVVVPIWALIAWLIWWAAK